MPSMLNSYSQKINDFFFNLKKEMNPRKPGEVRFFVNEFYKKKRYVKSITQIENFECENLKMRLYRKNKIVNNCIIYIHGGGFVFGDLDHVDYFVSDLCEKTN